MRFILGPRLPARSFARRQNAQFNISNSNPLAQCARTNIGDGLHLIHPQETLRATRFQSLSQQILSARFRQVRSSLEWYTAIREKNPRSPNSLLGAGSGPVRIE